MNKIGKSRKIFRIVDIKGVADEGLDRLGLSLVVWGWVRTLRMQSSVTFIEANGSSCLSNMQWMSSDAEGYDQVLYLFLGHQALLNSDGSGSAFLCSPGGFLADSCQYFS